MRSTPFRSITPWLVACACLALAACSGAADGFQNGNVQAYTAPLETSARWQLTADMAQPTAAAANPHCAVRNTNGLSFFVADGGVFGNGAAGLAFGPLALLMPQAAGLSAGPVSSTTFFMGIRLDPRAAPWMQPDITNTQLEYLTPLDSACGF